MESNRFIPGEIVRRVSKRHRLRPWFQAAGIPNPPEGGFIAAADTETFKAGAAKGLPVELDLDGPIPALGAGWSKHFETDPVPDKQWTIRMKDHLQALRRQAG